MATELTSDDASLKAARCGDLEIIQGLLKSGPKRLFVARDEAGFSCAGLAAFNGHLEILTLLVEADCTCINDKLGCGTGLLHWASLGGHSRVVKYLLEKRPELAAEANESGLLPIHFAIQEGKVDVFKGLLKENPDSINCVDGDDNTLLHWASLNCQDEIIDLLLVASSDLLKKRNRDGMTALHLAVDLDSVECAQLLLEERDIKDDHGRTPLEIASGGCVALLEN